LRYDRSARILSASSVSSDRSNLRCVVMSPVLLGCVKAIIFGASSTRRRSERDTMSSEEERERTKTNRLEWRDYVALVVASLETTLLPILVMIAMLVLFALVVIRR